MANNSGVAFHFCSVYMDDSMDSTQSEENAIELYKQLSRLLAL